MSFFFLDVKGLVFIAKKPVMPKDVSVSFDVPSLYWSGVFCLEMFYSLLTEVYCFCSRFFTVFTCSIKSAVLISIKYRLNIADHNIEIKSFANIM